MSMEYLEISKNRLKALAKLKQKKYRLTEKQVIIEGTRTLQQMADYGIKPLEQFLIAGEKPIWKDVPTFLLKDWEIGQICDSESPAGMATLVTLPEPGLKTFRYAFYLDGISDPGNLGSIFRVAAAFGIEGIILSPQCVEISSPKVIRASLGSVYKIPHEVLNYDQISELKSKLVVTEMQAGQPLTSFNPGKDERTIVVLGSEAHGVSERLKAMADEVIHIKMSGEMESLNVAVTAGIIGHHLYLV